MVQENVNPYLSIPGLDEFDRQGVTKIKLNNDLNYDEFIVSWHFLYNVRTTKIFLFNLILKINH